MVHPAFRSDSSRMYTTSNRNNAGYHENYRECRCNRFFHSFTPRNSNPRHLQSSWSTYSFRCKRETRTRQSLHYMAPAKYCRGIVCSTDENKDNGYGKTVFIIPKDYITAYHPNDIIHRPSHGKDNSTVFRLSPGADGARSRDRGSTVYTPRTHRF